MTKDTLISCIDAAPTKGFFSSYMPNGIECEDQLLKVGFKTFTVGTIRWFVFMPTMNKLNWFFNFVFPLYTVPYGNKDSPIRIHSGFLAGYISLRSEVHNIVKQDTTSTGFVFCGHSLGGALARLGAVDVQYNFNKEVVVYTLGAPNVGNKEFEESFNKRIKHSVFYINDGDPVPEVPPEFTGYTRYIRTRLPKKYNIKFWLNHLPELYFTNLKDRDTTKEIL